MAYGTKTAGRRRLRLARLRPETTSGEGLRAMIRHLSAMLGVDTARARLILLQMGRGKNRVA